MKKSFILLTAVFLLNAPVAKSLQPSMFLNDSESFRIAKSVKLGYGDSSRSPSKGTGTKTSEFKTCSSDNNCPTTQECVNGNCKDLCSPNPCPEQKPDCEAKDHSYTCTCTETSCGEGKECVNGKCESCTVGTKCNCDGEKVLGTNGTCVCPSGLSCSAGQYVGDDCSCTSCPENDTRENKCGCPGNTVPDGNGSCYCKTTKSCDEGYSFDSSNTCECVACTDNDSCDNPCSAGTIPTPDGCKAYACAVDEDCAEGNRCENGGTESAQCVPCGKNEQCRCPEGQLSDGTGKCVSVTCKTGLVCSKDITKQCCDAGMQCVNPDTVESYCAACEVDTQCTCPDGYLVNKEGKCVKPACTKNSDCPNGKYCENPGKSNAECVPCNEGEPCPTCPPGYVADGNGGCKLGCTFDSASVCVSGTTNCKTCTQSGGCYTCTDCKDGYYPDNGTCVSCKQKFGDNCEKCTPNKCLTCDQWYEPDPYTGKCKPKACPSGYSTTTTASTCERMGVGWEYKSDGISGSLACGKCFEKACPTNYSTDDTETTCSAKGEGWQYLQYKKSGDLPCGRCAAKDCPDGSSTTKTCTKGTKAENLSNYSGNSVCKKCVNCNAGEQCACPAGQVADGNGGCKSADPCANVTCDGGKVCSAGSCVCPSNKPYSAGGQCRECTSDSHCGNTQSCSNYQCVDLSCSSCETASNHQCVTKACPDGWNSPENIPFCLNGQTKKTDSCGCWKCEGEACPAGYTRGTPFCLTSQKVATIGKKVNGQYCSKCVDKDCYDYGYIPQTKGCPEGEKMMAVPIPEASYLSCGKCSEINYFPIGGGDGPTKCSSSQLDCGSIGCCPKHPNGCAEYANDCKYAGNGMYTACRCMVYDTTSKFIN